MTNCNTLVCVSNQMPDMGMDDYFVVATLVFYVVLLVFMFYVAWKGLW